MYTFVFIVIAVGLFISLFFSKHASHSRHSS